MSTPIISLTYVSDVSSGDQWPFWSTANGKAFRTSTAVLLQYMQDNLDFPSGGIPEFTTQRYSPQATGFSITVNDGTDHGENVHLILTPAAAYATGTVVLPALATCVDKQEVMVTATQQVTALTITLSGGATGVNLPSTIAAGKTFCLKLDKDNSIWYCIWK